MTEVKKAIQIDERDNVATVTSEVRAAESVQVLSPEGAVLAEALVKEAIPFGHKVALADIKVGERVVKYGETIGLASKQIKKNEWVHIHNVESAAVPTSAFRRK